MQFKEEKPNIIIIGNGMVSHKFCDHFIKQSGYNAYNLIVFGEETRPAYDRVHLSEYFDHYSAEDLSMASEDWYQQNYITLYTGDPILEINRDKKTVTSHKGLTLAYDKLIMATGSSAFVPPIEGVEKEGVFVYRTIEDLEAITDYAKKCNEGAVMGGGLLGLEAAKAMYDMGLKTHVIEFAPRLMPKQLDDIGASVLQEQIENLGISIHTSKKTKSIKGDRKIKSIEFDNDNVINNVEMLIISAGIRPRDELAKKSGLEVGTKGGIQVNDHLQTSDPDIYAIGEAALHNDMIYGLVAPGYDMAVQVADQILSGEKLTFNGADMSTKLKLIGADVASFGDCFGASEESRSIVYHNRSKGIYKRINVSEDNERLIGGILVGDTSDYGMLQQAVINKMALPPEPEDLILGPRGGEGSNGMGVDNLPGDAIICSCESISKENIVHQVTDNECSNFQEVSACTKAGTGCGGCTPMVKDLITETLKSQGKEVKNVICEHFNYERQELYHMVKVRGLKSYEEVLKQFGEGDGCEVCKPAVASVLASIYNEPITQQDTIQDTNDRFLANIQKGGSYSVVPRVPGGEITPDKLIALGEVAKKYNLYTKITGGQRVDLFGAALNDLPNIWEELIEAGFESGHAYGKALRTVKSCVGQEWCRYGVQDSVGLAIELENRYKGLRSPHKLKSACSGCVRECAEAQSKDFGVIATDNGWNLFVGGNGGANPQHAQLLASDIDRETVIKYLDRFLMFYIRTAPPLTRTASWLNKLEGGIDYVKRVVIDDELGIAEELEQEMQSTLFNYKCEWKDVVEDPEKRKKFSHFINSDEKDDHMQFTEQRNQKVPAGW